ATDAATTLSEVNVVYDEDGKRVGLNLLLLGHVVAYLLVEVVDINLAHHMAERRPGLAVLGRHVESQLGKDGDAGVRASQQQVGVGVVLHDAPEVAALEGVDVLRVTQVHAALGVVGGVVKDRGGYGSREGAERASRNRVIGLAAAEHDLDRNHDGRNQCSLVSGWICAHHDEVVLVVVAGVERLGRARQRRLGRNHYEPRGYFFISGVLVLRKNKR